MNQPAGYARPHLGMFAGATAISFSAIFFRLSGVSPITGAFYRMVYAIPFLLIIWKVRSKGHGRSRRERMMAMAAGALLSADIVFWHTSIGMIGAGLATLIANSQVIIVPVVTTMMFGEHVPRRILLTMPVVMVGLALITGLGRADTYGDRPLLGVTLAVIAATLYSGFLIGFRRANRSLSPPVGPLLDAVIGATVVAAIAGGVLGGLDLAPTWPAHGWLVGLALVAQVLGWLFIGYALPRLPAAHSSFAILLQPSLTIVWGALIFGERASIVQGVGVGLVLTGIGVVSLTGRRRVPTTA